MEKERNLVEDETHFYSIDDSSADNNSADEYIRTYSIDGIWDGNHLHTNINATYAKTRIRE